jgi:predicted nucleic acid-binding protein
VRVVLDLNVILDVLLTRHDSLECSEVLSLARSGAIEAILPAHALTTIYYISRKKLNDDEVRKELRAILNILTVASLDRATSQKALDSPLADFEDAVVVETAIQVNADFIVTRNLHDFAESPISAMTSRAFMEHMFRV